MKPCPECAAGSFTDSRGCPLCLGAGRVPVDYGLREEYRARMRERRK